MHHCNKNFAALIHCIKTSFLKLALTLSSLRLGLFCQNFFWILDLSYNFAGLDKTVVLDCLTLLNIRHYNFCFSGFSFLLFVIYAFFIIIFYWISCLKLCSSLRCLSLWPVLRRAKLQLSGLLWRVWKRLTLTVLARLGLWLVTELLLAVRSF